MDLTLTLVAVVGHRAQRVLAPTPVRVRGGAVSIDGSTRARDSALAEILMV
jgi:hypothetical protein